jgi:hypothetical protein
MELYLDSFQMEEPRLDEWEAEIEAEINSYRNVRVRGALGDIVFKATSMPIARVRELQAGGVGVPLDIMPVEYWHAADPGGNDIGRDPRGAFVMPNSEEALGEDF